MPKVAVNPPSLAKPVGFSHGFEVHWGRLLFLAGQEAQDKDGKIVGRGDIVAQFRQICHNFKTVVESQGGTLQDIVKLTICVLDNLKYRTNAKAIGQV